ncbi:hypothetical protein [Salipiger mangrovisoli]|uniref:Flagellar FliJ protein n=1 Tax=Salipiger mangrovisoli TaxID=2865933 RepID=A0ABR9WX96_9RHOB|nr:hypothetical protein [Salipiger mangrovisoli]MBE9635913.1 hypothetical protein [Salipiger mangrovisoli]
MNRSEADLLRVSALLRDRALAAYRRDLDAETSLRAERDRIDALRMAALDEGPAMGAHQLLGMAALWQGELLRRRAVVQLGLAEARARQGYSSRAARAAFSRDMAARQIVDRSRDDRVARQLAAEERALEALAALRLWQHAGGRG